MGGRSMDRINESVCSNNWEYLPEIDRRILGCAADIIEEYTEKGFDSRELIVIWLELQLIRFQLDNMTRFEIQQQLETLQSRFSSSRRQIGRLLNVLYHPRPLQGDEPA